MRASLYAAAKSGEERSGAAGKDGRREGGYIGYMRMGSVQGGRGQSEWLGCGLWIWIRGDAQCDIH